MGTAKGPGCGVVRRLGFVGTATGLLVLWKAWFRGNVWFCEKSNRARFCENSNRAWFWCCTRTWFCENSNRALGSVGRLGSEGRFGSVRRATGLDSVGTVAGLDLSET